MSDPTNPSDKELWNIFWRNPRGDGRRALFDAGVAAERERREAELAARRDTFWTEVHKERVRQVDLGYTPEHDDEHGVKHLLYWAGEYAARGETVKSAALILAARQCLHRAAERERAATENEADAARIADIRQRLWNAGDEMWIVPEGQRGDFVRVSPEGKPDVWLANTCSGPGYPNDAVAQFVAHARSDIPWLLDQLASRRVPVVPAKPDAAGSSALSKWQSQVIENGGYWEYETTTGPRKQWHFSEQPPEGDGWVRDTERGRDGWERFDYHEESYWKRWVGPVVPEQNGEQK